MKNIKRTLTLTIQEFSDISNVFAEAQNYESDFVKIKDRRIRKLFIDSIKRRHKLWLKIRRCIE